MTTGSTILTIFLIGAALTGWLVQLMTPFVRDPATQAGLRNPVSLVVLGALWPAVLPVMLWSLRHTKVDLVVHIYLGRPWWRLRWPLVGLSGTVKLKDPDAWIS